MKSISILFLLTFTSMAQASVCDDPIGNKEICNSMKHIRSHIHSLGAQRDLLQVNYPYLQAIAEDLKANTGNIIEKSKDDSSHTAGMVSIYDLSNQLLASSTKNQSDAFILGNKIQSQCLACHANNNPASGSSWNEIFKNDWSKFYTRCNQADRNPYLCKNMYGMFSAYSFFFTSANIEQKNYNLAYESAKEIARIAKDLSDKEIFHGSIQDIKEIQIKATGIMKLANDKNPETFTQGLSITQSCLKCHSEKSQFH